MKNENSLTLPTSVHCPHCKNARILFKFSSENIVFSGDPYAVSYGGRSQDSSYDIETSKYYCERCGYSIEPTIKNRLKREHEKRKLYARHLLQHTEERTMDTSPRSGEYFLIYEKVYSPVDLPEKFNKGQSVRLFKDDSKGRISYGDFSEYPRLVRAKDVFPAQIIFCRRNITANEVIKKSKVYWRGQEWDGENSDKVMRIPKSEKLLVPILFPDSGVETWDIVRIFHPDLGREFYIPQNNLLSGIDV